MARRITLPNPVLVVLCGPAGSGKSTFARRRFRETTIVSSDRCRAMISDREANITVSPEAFELFHFIIDLRLRHRRVTVADSTALRREARHELLTLARRHGVPAVLIAFHVSEERAQKWNVNRRRRVGRPVIHEQWERLQEALRTVQGEGFDQVYILGEDEVGTAQVQIAAGSQRGAPSPASRRDGG